MVLGLNILNLMKKGYTRFEIYEEKDEKGKEEYIVIKALRTRKKQKHEEGEA